MRRINQITYSLDELQALGTGPASVLAAGILMHSYRIAAETLSASNDADVTTLDLGAVRHAVRGLQEPSWQVGLRLLDSAGLARVEGDRLKLLTWERHNPTAKTLLRDRNRDTEYKRTQRTKGRTGKTGSSKAAKANAAPARASALDRHAERKTAAIEMWSRISVLDPEDPTAWINAIGNAADIEYLWAAAVEWLYAPCSVGAVWSTEGIAAARKWVRELKRTRDNEWLRVAVEWILAIRSGRQVQPNQWQCVFDLSWLDRYQRQAVAAAELREQVNESGKERLQRSRTEGDKAWEGADYGEVIAGYVDEYHKIYKCNPKEVSSTADAAKLRELMASSGLPPERVIPYARWRLRSDIPSWYETRKEHRIESAAHIAKSGCGGQLPAPDAALVFAEARILHWKAKTSVRKAG